MSLGVEMRVPLFPLHAVLFPGGRLPLRLFEQRYLRMAALCLREDLPFGVCRIVEGQEVGAPALTASIGCLARIAQWDMPRTGVLDIVALGQARFRALDRHVQTDGLAEADVELLPPEVDAPSIEACPGCVELLERILRAPSREPRARDPGLGSSLWVSARLAELLPLPLDLKQALLEIDDGAVRLRRLRDALSPVVARPPC